MSNSSRILDLATTIQSQVHKIHQHLEASGNGDPSFDGQAPYIEFYGINDTRAAVLENLTELIDLLSTPTEILQQKTATDFLSRHALDRFNVYDVVPVGETRTYEQISTVTGQPVPIIRRIIRHAMN
jgi:O6-methylguanine-DNA--protein-cysteine methyltransferase